MTIRSHWKTLATRSKKLCHRTSATAVPSLAILGASRYRHSCSKSLFFHLRTLQSDEHADAGLLLIRAPTKTLSLRLRPDPRRRLHLGPFPPRRFDPNPPRRARSFTGSRRALFLRVPHRSRHRRRVSRSRTERRDRTRTYDCVGRERVEGAKCRGRGTRMELGSGSGASTRAGNEKRCACAQLCWLLVTVAKPKVRRRRGTAGGTKQVDAVWHTRARRALAADSRDGSQVVTVAVSRLGKGR